MTHFLHTQADLEAGLAQLILADPRLQAGRREGRRLRPAPARGGLCRPVRHRVRPAALDRERRRDPRPAVRGLRSVSSRHGAPRARRQAQAARPVRAENQIDPRDRQGRRQGPHRSRRASAIWTPTQRTPHSPRCTASGRGPPTSICLFCLGHADAFPAGDLAVQESARIALGLRKRPDAKALAKIAEAWRPWRGVAAHLLWAYYHAVKKRDVVPVQPQAKKPKAKKRKSENG